FTFGDTIVSISDFDMLVRSTEPLDYFERLHVTEESDQVAVHIASVIEDGDCLCFRMPTSLSRALCRRLTGRRHLGIHSPYFTDELMDLVKSGAVSNYRKGVFRGKSIASYALGTRALLAWLDRNPLVEMQSIGQVCDPTQIGRNPNFVGVFHARKVDLFSRVSSFVGRESFTSGPSIAADMINGAEISAGGRTIFGLPSRDEKGESNIQVVLEDYRSQYHMRESINMVVTEYGIANLKWRSIRERAQALIDIAHPDDREELVEKAKEKKILFPDQIFLSKSARLYPMDIAAEYTFKGGVKVRFRAIKPSDEGAMRRFFYRFSDQTIYRRYFYPIKTMPHNKMQEYVNVDYGSAMSIVALVGKPDSGKIIGEARFVRDEQSTYGEVAFVVDEEYQGIGVASYLYEMLIRLAKERGLTGLTAEVMLANKGMMKVFEKGEYQVIAQLQNDVYRLTIPFDVQLSPARDDTI
ncbi:MAG: GNAT family N-acetyltransferase, partial [Desulfobacterales bacterium]|nr:GNAT family N-acetyltransferase [Desulfobacterales bacterium]